MQRHGYRIIPVNPAIESALEEKADATLLDIPETEKVDIVNIFRRSEFVPKSSSKPSAAELRPSGCRNP